MANTREEILQGFLRPFPKSEIKKLPKGGKKFDYIDARAVMNRLDEIVGVDGWQTSFRVLNEDKNGQLTVECNLLVRIGEGWISRVDVGHSGQARGDDAAKGAYSDALKRAAVQFGIGRHLYGDISDTLLASLSEAPGHASDGHGGNDYQFLREELEGCNVLNDLKDSWQLVKESWGKLSADERSELEAVKDARKKVLATL